MNINRLLGVFFFLLLVTIPATVHAAGVPSCQPIYGGGTTCAQTGKVTVNKVVKDPSKNEFVDNLESNNPYKPEQEVTFQIEAKNTSSESVSKLTVKDVLPQFVSFVSAPNGKYDQKSNSITFAIDKINPNEAKVFTVKGKIAKKENLPANQSSVCLINQAFVSVSTISSQDHSTFCIKIREIAPSSTTPTTKPTEKPTLTPNKKAAVATTKGGLPVHEPTKTKETPPTGPEAFALFGLVPTGALGLWLRKKS